MKLIVALGNIGDEYINTRHNVGFMVVDSIWSDFRLENKFQCYMKEDKIGNEKYLIIKPTTYMNNSGIAVSKVVNYYHIDIKDILVIQDDLDLSFGTYKLKRNSSAGGHNGIKSIISYLNSDAFLRLKIGIAHPSDGNVVNYVLGKFSKSELESLAKSNKMYYDIIMSFIKEGIDKTLLNYSRK